MHTDETFRETALHIDVLSNGNRIIDKLFDHQRHISIGRSRRNAVVLADAHAPLSWELFHRRGRDYTLHYADDMKGAVSRAPNAAWHDLSEMHGASSIHGRGFDLALEAGAHGRVVVGDETLLFEVVEAPVRAIARSGRWLPIVLVLLGALMIGLIIRALVLEQRAMPRPPAPIIASAAAVAPASAAAAAEYELPFHFAAGR
jgi:hypothetical protein